MYVALTRSIQRCIIIKSENIMFDNIAKRKDWSILNPNFKVASLYSAKGLEFDTVIIPRLNQDIVPLKINSNNPEELKEFLEVERGLLYVGMTRARKSLYMISSGEQSQFIHEFQKDKYKVIIV